MNENHQHTPQSADLEAQTLEGQDLNVQNLNTQDLEAQRWAALLSKTAKNTPADVIIVPTVLEALRVERERTDDGSIWARYLSSAVQLHSSDFDAVKPALQAVRLERRRAGQWRDSLTRFIATTAAIAAVVAAVAVFSPPLSADPTEAYSAYQEAARGW